MTEEENTTSGTVLCTPQNPSSGLNTAEGFMSACEANGEVTIEFRPTDSYNGSFGFDWLRVGDTNFPGDVDYKSIMGWHLGDDANKSFIANSSKFEELKQHYSPVEKHPTDENENYYTPVVTLRRGETANVDMLVTVNKIPSEIVFDYDTSYFQINDEFDTSLLSVGQVKTKMNDHLSIKCINDFESEQYVKVMGNGKFIGQLKFLPNKGTSKSLKICFVQVESGNNTQIESGNTNIGRVSSNSVDSIKKFLNQAFVSFSDIKLSLNLTEGNDTITDFFDLGKEGLDYERVAISDQGFSKFLRRAFSKKYGRDTYKEYYKIYYINEDVINNLLDNQIPTYGRSYELRNFPPTNDEFEDNDPKDIVAIFRPGLNDITAAHELFHALGVVHSYEENDLFSYKVLSTHNLMDYNNSSSKINTWQWQWKQINSNL